MAQRSAASAQGGFSYAEVLVAAVLVAVTILPAISAFRSAGQSTAAHQDLVRQQFYLSSRMEELLATPFATLDAEALLVADETVPTAFSDAPGPDRRLVFLSRYDPDTPGNPFNPAVGGLVWIKVQLENTNLAITSMTAL